MKKVFKFKYELRRFLVLGVTVFFAEMAIDTILDRYFGHHNRIFTSMIDATLLTLLLFPVFYRFMYRPLVREIAIRGRAENRFRTFFESSPYALLAIVDESGAIMLVNHQVEEVFGYSPEELIGKKIETLVPDRFLQKHLEERLNYMKCPSPRKLGVGRDLYGRHKDGHDVLVEIALTPINTEEGAVILTTVTDIRVRKAIEKQRDDALKAREELVAVVSHEIRNPLTSIAMGLQVIHKMLPMANERKDQIQQQLEQISNATTRTTKITSDLLDVTRIEAGILAIEPKANNVATLVQELVAQLQPLAQKKLIHLEINMSPEVRTLTCDRDRLMQVFSNLLGNAIKFTDNGGSVFIEADARKEGVYFQVRDTGAGIPSEEMGHVFDRFWQAKHTQYLGSGLGLYISKNIVEAHGGTIGVTSKVGEGTTFHFMIPFSAGERKVA